MDFIALKCNLGLAVKQALEQFVADQDDRKNAENAYKEIFKSQYEKIKDHLCDANLTGNVFTWKQYPNEESRQYFQAYITQAKITANKGAEGIKNMKPLNFAKIQAMQPQGQNQKKQTKGRKSNFKSNKNKRAPTGSPQRGTATKKKKI